MDKHAFTRWCVDGCVGVVGFATPGSAGITGETRHLTRVLRSLTLTYMLTLDRDRLIVQSLARFGQLGAGHLRTMHFCDLASNTPLDRALKRLLERKYIARIERRMVGGTGAGSGQYVYQLGSAGWTLVGRPGRYSPYRAVNYHTLAIADAYVELLHLQHRGKLQIITYETEPHSWRKIAGIELRPDLYVELRTLWNDERHDLWLEIDMGTERREKITAKAVDYYNADGSLPEGESIPLVVFLAPDVYRVRELRTWIERGPEDAQRLFMVSSIPEFAPVLFA